MQRGIRSSRRAGRAEFARCLRSGGKHFFLECSVDWHVGHVVLGCIVFTCRWRLSCVPALATPALALPAVAVVGIDILVHCGLIEET